MEICTGGRSFGHEEIVFTSGHCPLCDALVDINDLQEEVNELKKELEKAENNEKD